MSVMSEARRIVKFSAVGAVAFAVDFCVFNLLRDEAAGLGPLWAKVTSVALATTVSWLGSRYWTFRDGKQGSPAREALWFFLVNAAGMLIAVGCLWVSHYLLDLRSALADNISGNVIGVALGNVFRYAMYRRVIYRIPFVSKPPMRQTVVAMPATEQSLFSVTPGPGAQLSSAAQPGAAQSSASLSGAASAQDGEERHSEFAFGDPTVVAHERQ